MSKWLKISISDQINWSSCQLVSLFDHRCHFESRLTSARTCFEQTSGVAFFDQFLELGLINSRLVLDFPLQVESVPVQLEVLPLLEAVRERGWAGQAGPRVGDRQAGHFGLNLCLIAGSNIWKETRIQMDVWWCQRYKPPNKYDDPIVTLPVETKVTIASHHSKVPYLPRH